MTLLLKEACLSNACFAAISSPRVCVSGTTASARHEVQVCCPLLGPVKIIKIVSNKTIKAMRNVSVLPPLVAHQLNLILDEESLEINRLSCVLPLTQQLPGQISKLKVHSGHSAHKSFKIRRHN